MNEAMIRAIVRDEISKNAGGGFITLSQIVDLDNLTLDYSKITNTPEIPDLSGYATKPDLYHALWDVECKIKGD